MAAAHLSVQKVKTTHNVADILTKAAGRETLERHKRTIGLRHVDEHSSQKELRLGKCRAQSSNACMCILFGSGTAVLLRQTCQYGLTTKCQLMVWIFEVDQRNVRDQMRMEFGLWSVIAKGYDVSCWMWSRRGTRTVS